MRLLTSPGCPLSRQVRIAALEHSIHVDEERFAEDLLGSINPLRRTPLVITNDGSALHDVAAIFTYMDTLHESPSLVPPESQWKVLNRVSLCTEFMRVISRRNDELHRTTRDESLISAYNDEISRVMAWLDNEVKFLSAGQQPLTADEISAACSLDYADFRYSLSWRLTFTNAQAWLYQIANRPSMTATRLS